MERTMTTWTLGFSSCPNDTFVFHALVHRRVPLPGITLAPVIEDIEALNLRALSAYPPEITKLSVGVLPALRDHYHVLEVGAALGRGCGPLVVGRPGGPSSLVELAGRRVAIPGIHTTAYRLLRMFAPTCEVVPMRFETIMPAVLRGDEVDAGLVIHESRFTYRAAGLECIADLGELWEAHTDMPLPLGVIVARRDLAPELVAGFTEALGASLDAAWATPDVPRPWIRELAQELDDEVCSQHIALYVNRWTRALGDDGRRALARLLAEPSAVA
jgi:5,8-dihydroxy-2-naphthoate synthase